MGCWTVQKTILTVTEESSGPESFYTVLKRKNMRMTLREGVTRSPLNINLINISINESIFPQPLNIEL